MGTAKRMIGKIMSCLALRMKFPMAFSAIDTLRHPRCHQYHHRYHQCRRRRCLHRRDQRNNDAMVGANHHDGGEALPHSKKVS